MARADRGSGGLQSAPEEAAPTLGLSSALAFLAMASVMLLTLYFLLQAGFSIVLLLIVLLFVVAAAASLTQVCLAAPSTLHLAHAGRSASAPHTLRPHLPRLRRLRSHRQSHLQRTCNTCNHRA